MANSLCSAKLIAACHLLLVKNFLQVLDGMDTVDKITKVVQDVLWLGKHDSW